MIRATIITSDKLNVVSTQPSPVRFSKRYTPSFIPAHDIARGVIFATQALLNYLFMLTVMYVISFSSIALLMCWTGQDVPTGFHTLARGRSQCGRDSLRKI